VHSCASGAKCPPFVILHDGEYSTVAFLSSDAMRSIGMNADDHNEARKTSAAATKGHEPESPASSLRAERASRRSQRNNATNSNSRLERILAAQRITLRGKCLASINHYTISTISQCLSNNCQHITSVLNSLDIPHHHHKQLSPLKQFMMCIYVTGSITVIGGENGGVIGESNDVHCSVKVRRALHDFVGQSDDDVDGYAKLLKQLEEVHLHFQNEAWNKLSRDNERTVRKSSFVQDWPWESQVQKQIDAVDTGRAGGDVVEQGNVTSLLNNDEELDAVLEGASEGEEADSGNGDIVGRASTGTMFAQWDIDSIDEGPAQARNNNSNGYKQGGVEEMFNNYEHLEDVIEFTQEPDLSNNVDSQEEQNTPARVTAKSTALARERSRDALVSPGNVVPFVGIDQMIASQSQDSEDDEPLLTQAETFETAVEEMIDSEPNIEHDIGSTAKYFSANENEPSDEDPDESQIPIRAIKRPYKSKRSRYSQIPIMEKRKKPSCDESAQNTPKIAHNSKARPNSLDGDDSDGWMKLKANPKRKSQVAGEGSEENSPVEIGANVEFDCVQDELIDTEDEKERGQEKQPDPAPVDEEEKEVNSVAQHEPDSSSTAEPPMRAVREFDYYRVLMRARRLSNK
jgi:hypothetical protein